jgi:hypothetical protein
MSHGPGKGPGQGGPARSYSWPPFSLATWPRSGTTSTRRALSPQ